MYVCVCMCVCMYISFFIKTVIIAITKKNINIQEVQMYK